MKWSVLATAVILTACGPRSQHPTDNAWTDEANAHARFFRLQTRGGQHRALVFGPGGTDDTLAVIDLSATPWQRVAVMSTTHVPYISALGLTDHIVAAAYLDAVRDASLRQRILNGQVVELVTGERLDREQLMLLSPDALFDQPFGRADRAPRAEGVLTVPVTEYLEEHPLGRAEWIRFFGAVMGRKAQADSLFAAIEARYDEAAQRVDTVTTRPVVFFGSTWQGRFHAAAGNSYMVRTLRDAGGTPWAKDTMLRENPPVDIEGMMALADEVDHVGLVVALRSPPDARALMGGDERLAHARGVEQGGFYANSEASDVFGQALLEPEVVLLDLIKVLHPERAQDHTPRYFHRIVQ
jgi:iron complex transport system substrate-binding protein